MEVVAISWLLQFDGLDDVAGEEQLDHPIAQHSNLALQAGQFSQINAAPQQPGEQSAETYGLPAREGNRQFGASRMMADHAERAQRIEVKWSPARGLAKQREYFEPARGPRGVRTARWADMDCQSCHP